MKLLIKTIKKIPSRLIETKLDFLILGAQKCGTTSIFSILEQHHKIRGSRPKKVQFFNRDDIDHKLNLRAYHSHFRPIVFVRKDILHFEATSSYFYHADVPKRLF